MLPPVFRIYNVAHELESVCVQQMLSQQIACLDNLHLNGVDVFVFITEKECLESDSLFLQQSLPDKNVLLLPPWDVLPYDISSPSRACMAQRLACLSALLHPCDRAQVVVTCIEALGQKTLSQDLLKCNSWRVKKGDMFSLPDFARQLHSLGYQKTEIVEETGDYAQRGGLIDGYFAGITNPIRIDFFGDEIESIKTFDPETQRTLEALDSFILMPTNELVLSQESRSLFLEGYRKQFGLSQTHSPLYAAVEQGAFSEGVEHYLPLFYKKLDSFFSYLAHKKTLILTTPLLQKIQPFFEKIQKNYVLRASVQGEASHPLQTDALYLSLEDFLSQASSFHSVELMKWDQTGNEKHSITCPIKPLLLTQNDCVSLQKILSNFPEKKVIFACRNSLDAQRLKARALHEKVVLSEDQVIQQALPESFYTENEAVIAPKDWMLKKNLTFQVKKTKRQATKALLENTVFQVGDYLVHKEHGVGKYTGIIDVTVQKIVHACLCLEYQDGDKLFLPVENMDVLSFYTAHTSENVILDKLGSTAWQARKARVKKRIHELAQKLILIAAQRKLVQVDPIISTQEDYEKFCAGFPYVETEDQARSIQEVLQDLQETHPMDRLVCGDVGFGKTEVALRAAFAVASQGGQVAILAPTTLLARQHYLVFQKRFENFPIDIGFLSRLQTAKELKQEKEDVAQGCTKILIGTHALLTAKLQFKDLRLLIIDEEQHFGVKQKEFLKARYPHIHLLSLSATPIPRTLQMAVSSIRDLSLITTPPMERRPVISKVVPFDALTIKEALEFEHARGGQSFVVCPRVSDIAALSETVEKLMPQARRAVLHGQMTAKAIEETMVQFSAQKIDILISTNIIESGLDLPSANTLIIYRSDLFGLSQLYQLRGRVGRSTQQGYAFFTVTPEKVLTKNANKRLEVLKSLKSLGSGFSVASYDMDIRGAGNLVGEEQSGQVKEVGLGLYQSMLEEAIASLKSNKEIEEEWAPQINLGIKVLIPDTYISDSGLRLETYRRIACLNTEEEAQALLDELEDRFGPMPEEIQNLFHTVSLKNLCKKAHIAKLDQGAKGLLISFYRNNYPFPEKIVQLMAESKGTVKLRADQKLAIFKAWGSPEQRQEGLRRVLSFLAEGYRGV